MDSSTIDQLNDIISRDNLEEFIQLESTTAIYYTTAFMEAAECGSYRIINHILDKNIEFTIQSNYIRDLSDNLELFAKAIRNSNVKPSAHLELISYMLRENNMEPAFEVWRDFYLESDKTAINLQSTKTDCLDSPIECTVSTFRLFLDLMNYGFVVDKEFLCTLIVDSVREDLVNEYIELGFKPCFNEEALEFAFDHWNVPIIDKIVETTGSNLKYPINMIHKVSKSDPNVIAKLNKWKEICLECKIDINSTYANIIYVSADPEILDWIFSHLNFKHNNFTVQYWSLNGKIEAIRWLWNKSVEGELEFKYQPDLLDCNIKHIEVLDFWLTKMKEGKVHLEYANKSFESLVLLNKIEQMNIWLNSGFPVKCRPDIIVDIVSKHSAINKASLIFWFGKYGDRIGFDPQLCDSFKQQTDEIIANTDDTSTMKERFKKLYESI